jgi:hypothetical protein
MTFAPQRQYSLDGLGKKGLCPPLLVTFEHPIALRASKLPAIKANISHPNPIHNGRNRVFGLVKNDHFIAGAIGNKTGNKV